MRRGLMAWNEAEIALAALEDRASRLREAMREEGFDGFLLYSNFPRPAAVAWLTSFTPYWSEAILYLPIAGEPVLATALSKRVGEWARSVNPIGEIVHSPRPGVEIGRRIAASAGARIGVLEFELFPNGLFEDCAAAAGAAVFADGSAVFARARTPVDATEKALLARADALARDGIAAVDPAMREAGQAVAAAEGKIRLGGAEEAYVAIAPDLDRDRRFLRLSGAAPLGRRFALRVSVAYKGSWVRRIATFARDREGAAVAARAAVWFEQTISSASAGAPLAAQIAAALDKLPGASATRFLAESCRGSYPLEAIDGAGATDWRPAAGSLLVLSLDLMIGGVPWSGGAPAIVSASPRHG